MSTSNMSQRVNESANQRVSESAKQREEGFEGVAAEVTASAGGLAALAIEAAQKLNDARLELVRLTIANTHLANLLAVKATECEGLRGQVKELEERLRVKGEKLSRLRQTVKTQGEGLRAFRRELIDERVYTAELTETIENDGIEGMDDGVGSREYGEEVEGE